MISPLEPSTILTSLEASKPSSSSRTSWPNTASSLFGRALTVAKATLAVAYGGTEIHLEKCWAKQILLFVKN
jgi:hypothetical protein